MNDLSASLAADRTGATFAGAVPRAEGAPAPHLVVDGRRILRGWSPEAVGLLGLGEVSAGMGLARVLAGAARLDGMAREVALAVLRAAQRQAGPAEAAAGALRLEARPVAARRWGLVFRPGQEAASAAASDALTGLPNRAAFRAALAGRRDAEGIGVLLVGLERFSRVTEGPGLAVGDALLVAVGRRLRAALREGDRVFRLDGDAFAVIVPEAGRAEAVATRLAELLGRTYLIQGHVCSIGASVGVACAAAGEAAGDEIVRRASLALGEAREAGGGLVRVFRPEMDAQARARHAMEAELRVAVVRNELELHYQPQIDVATRRLAGFEALLRWRHPEQGMVRPDAFIPLAEACGLIGALGDWALRAACRQCATWPAPLGVAVNVSPLQLAAPAALVRSVTEALAAAGLPASRLELEITESALMGDQAGGREALLALREMGVRIALDDFGTGYSSLSQLRAFPFDKIKIDRSFVTDVSTCQQAVAMVRAVTALGAGLGMATTAEGVETQDQAQRLGLEGCTYLQGYLVSRPVPPEQLGGLIERLGPPAAAWPPGEEGG